MSRKNAANSEIWNKGRKERSLLKIAWSGSSIGTLLVLGEVW